MKKTKKCLAAFLSIVLLLFSVPQIGIKANATNDNLLIDSSYLLYQASEYSESFQQIFGGSSSSYANTYFYSMRQDAGLMAAISSWEAIHIATEPSYSLESGLITKRDMYKLVIFDLLGVNNSIDTISNEQASYVFGIAKEILDDSDIDISELKSFEVTAEYVDLLSKSAKAAQMIDAVSVITKIANASINMFNAVNACASYQTISNMKNGTKEILTAITELPSGSLGEYFNDMDLKELQDAARECISYFDGAYNNVLERILNGTEPYSAAIIDTAVDLAMDWAWDTIVSAIPGGLAVLTAAKGIRALSNAVFDLDDSNRAYYQLEADIAFENAIRKIMTDANIDYTKQKDLTDASFYMQTVNMYKNVVLLGFDYSIDLLKKQASAPSTQMFDWLTGNYSECISLINEISEFKANKQMLYARFENIVYNAYKSLSPNYDDVINGFNNQVIVKVESVNLSQIKDINLGDTGYIDNYIQKTLSPENGTIDNLLSYTSENENILKIDALGFFEAVGVGECTLTFDKYGDLKSSITITIDPKENDEEHNYLDDFEYIVNADEKTATITKYKGSVKHLIIPQSIDGYLITKIENDTYDFNSNTHYQVQGKYYSSSVIVNNTVESIFLSNSIEVIGPCAFRNCTNLKKISIPNSVKEISIAAFENCTSLVNINIPNSVETIGNCGFKNCIFVKEMSMSNKVETIPSSCFYGCEKLTEINLPIHLKEIQQDAFANCYSLTEIIIPRSVLKITDPFSNCTLLKEVTLPISTEYIDSYVWDNPKNITNVNLTLGVNNNGYFGYGISSRTSGDLDGFWYASRENIKNIHLEEGIKEIPDYFLYECENAVQINLPVGIEKIGVHAFSGCSSLKYIHIPDTVKTISYGAFSNCESLTEIVIPDEVENLEIWTFNRCSNLKTVTLPVSCIIERDCFEETYPTHIIYTKGINGRFVETENIGINGSMHSVSVPWDYSENSVTNVVFEEGVKNISDLLFYNCSSLSSITLPDSLVEIGDFAFLGCASLQNISLPAKLETIGVGSFAKSGLKEIVFPQNLSDVGYGTFYSCDSLTSVVFYNESTELMPANNNINDDVSLYMHEYGDNKFTDSDYGYFEGCSSLISIVLPDSVSIIGNQTFMNCTKLETIELPNKLTQIKQRAFLGCNKLNEIYISETVQCIEKQAVGYDENTNKKNDFVIYGKQNSEAHIYANKNGFMFIADVPNNITERGQCNGDVIWEYYESSKTLLIDGTGYLSFPGQNATPYEYPWSQYLDNIENIIIEEGITGLSSYSFYQHNQVKNVIIKAKITSIPQGIFSHCSNLKSINLPETVTGISSYAFAECTNLETINLTSKLKSIGDHAFENCTNLQNIELNNVNSFGHGAFRNCKSIKNITLSNYIKTISGNYMYGGTFENCESLEEIIIPDSVTEIEEYAFKGCTALSRVIISENSQLEYVGDHAFTSTAWIEDNSYYTDGFLMLNNCLIKVNDNYNGVCYLPKGITYVSKGSFDNCDKVTVVMIPEGVTEIEYEAFDNCRNIVAIYIPKSIKTIDYWNFSSAYDLYHVLYAGTEEEWNAIDVKDSGNSNFINATKHYGVSDEVITLNVTKAPTCTESGTATFSCLICNALCEVTLDQVEHNGKLISTIPATCTSDGYDIFLCSNCDCEYNTNFTTALGHHFIDGLCGNCGVHEDDCIESEHNYSNNSDEIWTITKNGAIKIAITFSEDTYTERNYDYIYIYDAEDNLVGKYDGDELANQTIEVDSDTIKIRLTSDSSSTAYGFKVIKIEAYYDECQHMNNEIINYVETSCTNDGYSGDIYCRDCMMIVEYGEITSSTGHNYTSSIITPTCTENGYTIFSCSACGDSYETDKKEKLGHNLGEWICTKEATCSEPGEEISMCSRCEHQENRTINVLSHTNSDGNSFCDVCEYDVTLDCSHISHSDNWFLSFIWKVALFFNRIFGNNKYCDCGVAHW